jgi:serine protease Do
MKKRLINVALVGITCLSVGLALGYKFTPNPVTADNLKLDEQEATVRAVKRALPAVVSIVVYDQESVLNVNIDANGTSTQSLEQKEMNKGNGSGFLISSDGLILTNKHISTAGKPDTVRYKVVLNNKKIYDAQLIGNDPLHDLAVLKIKDTNLPYLEMAQSGNQPIGLTVLAIGNSLGRYENSVTKGIVSGLGRSLTAANPNGGVELLDNVLQTDAEINEGNSGGPLINLEGKVVGVNVAVDKGGTGLGFAIPIDDARSVVDSVRKSGRIIRVRLGVRYLMLDAYIAEAKGASSNVGALIAKDETGQPAVVQDSPADKAGLQEGDIILEINAIKINDTNGLLSVIQRYKPGNKIGIKIKRGNDIFNKTIVLDEFTQ